MKDLFAPVRVRYHARGVTSSDTALLQSDLPWVGLSQFHSLYNRGIPDLVPDGCDNHGCSYMQLT